ncbi:MAG: hypothetical protein AAF333_05975 [Planctomycetota bacterium]
MTADAPHQPATPLTPDTPVPFPVLRSAGKLLGAAMFPAGLISVGLHLLGQPVHAQVNLIAAAICGVSAALALLPVWVLSKHHRHGAAQGFMAGIMLRILLCAAAVLGLQWVGYPHDRLLIYYAAAWYLVTLVVEVKLVSSFLLAHAVAPAVPGNPAANPTAGYEPNSANASPPRTGLQGDV